MTRFKPRCELCGQPSLCDVCRGVSKLTYTVDTSELPVLHNDTETGVNVNVIHTVSGKPLHVAREWLRLARENDRPS